MIGIKNVRFDIVLFAIIYLVCTAVPPIPRPKENTFLRYAKEGKKEQIAQVLFHYPDLIHTKNESVSDL